MGVQMTEREEAEKMAREIGPAFREQRVADAILEFGALEAERAVKTLSDEGFVGLPKELTGRAAYLRSLKK